MSDHIHYTLDSKGIATILLDRPSKLNALTLDMVKSLGTAIDQAIDNSARVLLIRSAGDRAFCVGADIKQFATFTPEQMWGRWISSGHRVFRALNEVPMPTVAVIDGPAFGGGLELALSCDLRIASTDATFGLPETGIGTVPGWGGTDTLTRAIGRTRANAIILARKTIDADTAESWGLINEVHPSAELPSAVEALVRELLAGAPLAQQTAKQLIRAADSGASPATLEALASGFTAATPDFTEGVNAFLSKRPAQFGRP